MDIVATLSLMVLPVLPIWAVTRRTIFSMFFGFSCFRRSVSPADSEVRLTANCRHGKLLPGINYTWFRVRPSSSFSFAPFWLQLQEGWDARAWAGSLGQEGIGKDVGQRRWFCPSTCCHGNASVIERSLEYNTLAHSCKNMRNKERSDNFVGWICLFLFTFATWKLAGWMTNKNNDLLWSLNVIMEKPSVKSKKFSFQLCSCRSWITHFLGLMASGQTTTIHVGEADTGTVRSTWPGCALETRLPGIPFRQAVW